MNAESFFKQLSGFEPETEIGSDWVPFSNLKDATLMMEKYAAHKKSEWFEEAFKKPPILPHLIGSDSEKSEKVLVYGNGVTAFASYNHTTKCWIPLGTVVSHWMWCPNDPGK